MWLLHRYYRHQYLISFHRNWPMHGCWCSKKCPMQVGHWSHQRPRLCLYYCWDRSHHQAYTPMYNLMMVYLMWWSSLSHEIMMDPLFVNFLIRPVFDCPIFVYYIWWIWVFFLVLNARYTTNRRQEIKKTINRKVKKNLKQNGRNWCFEEIRLGAADRHATDSNTN